MCATPFNHGMFEVMNFGHNKSDSRTAFKLIHPDNEHATSLHQKYLECDEYLPDSLATLTEFTTEADLFLMIVVYY